MTCYCCNETTCNDCKPIGICDDFYKVFCNYCNPTSWCDFCKRTKCVQCCRGVHHCEDCNTILCDDCVPMCCCHSCGRIMCSECGPLLYCQGECWVQSACMDCSNQTQNVWWWDVCESAYCPDCRLHEYHKSSDEFCLNCQGTLCLAFSGNENNSLPPTIGRIVNQSGSLDSVIERRDNCDA